jgi:hypothetical protein
MMTVDDIKKDLLKYVKKFYQDVEILSINVPEEEVELKFNLSYELRKKVMIFFEDNIASFNDYTEETKRDIMVLDNICIRFDPDGIYFGKSGYDYTASNAAAYFVLNMYLNDMVEEMPEKMKAYRDTYLYN